MAKKRPQLSPELRQKYRTWLRAQRTAGIDYGQDESGETVVAGTPLTAEETEGAEQWLRDVEHVRDIEFEESDEDDEEDGADEEPTSGAAGLLQKIGMSRQLLIVLGCVLAAAAIVTFLRM